MNHHHTTSLRFLGNNDAFSSIRSTPSCMSICHFQPCLHPFKEFLNPLTKSLILKIKMTVVTHILQQLILENKMQDKSCRPLNEEWLLSRWRRWNIVVHVYATTNCIIVRKAIVSSDIWRTFTLGQIWTSIEFYQWILALAKVESKCESPTDRYPILSHLARHGQSTLIYQQHLFVSTKTISKTLNIR